MADKVGSAVKKGKRQRKQIRDVNQLAQYIVREATEPKRRKRHPTPEKPQGGN
jgi:hypothetical protein